MIEIRVTGSGTAVDDTLHDVAAGLADRLAGFDAGPAAPTLLVHAFDLPASMQTVAPGRVVRPVYLGRVAAVIGPLWTSGGPGPCPRCLERRWRALRSVAELTALENADGAFAMGPLPGVTPFTVDMVAAVVTDRAVARDTRVAQIRYDTLEVTWHPIVADSSCEWCAQPVPDMPDGAVITFVPRPKPTVDAQRLRPVTGYGLPVDAYANPVCGMLSSAVFPAHHVGPAAPASGAFRTGSIHGAHEISWSGHATDYRTSTYVGVLEGLERHASLYPRTKTTMVYDSYANLAIDAVDPRGFGMYPDEFYVRYPGAHRRFAEDQAMHWVWGYSLGQGRPVLVPEQLVYYLDWRAEYANFVQECSNGCASGSCLEEAVLYGLLELVERDAFLLQWYGRGRPPEIDLGTCTDAETRAMAERLDLLGYDTHLFDIRVDLPIPAVMAVARRREPAELGNLCFSASTGLDPERAVAAALRETASYVLDMTTLSARIAPQLREMVHDYTKVTDLAHHSMLYGLPEMSQHAAFLFEGDPPRPLDGLYKDWSTGYPATGDLTDDLHRCLDLVRGLGFDVIVVDQTSPEQVAVGISTACVLVPGLLPIDFGWLRQRAPAMPRMRTAFRTAGLRDHDLEQGDLHLHPHPFP